MDTDDPALIGVNELSGSVGQHVGGVVDEVAVPLDGGGGAEELRGVRCFRQAGEAGGGGDGGID